MSAGFRPSCETPHKISLVVSGARTQRLCLFQDQDCIMMATGSALKAECSGTAQLLATKQRPSRTLPQRTRKVALPTISASIMLCHRSVTTSAQHLSSATIATAQHAKSRQLPSVVTQVLMKEGIVAEIPPLALLDRPGWAVPACTATAGFSPPI